MNGPVKIAQAGRATILDAAARAYPYECCGLLVGLNEGDGWRITEVHETANISDFPRRSFLADPQVQFDLMRKLRGTAYALIGCFHSHPDGPPAPSAADLSQAFESDFLYLIAAGGRYAGFSLKAFRFDGTARFFEELVLSV